MVFVTWYHCGVIPQRVKPLLRRSVLFVTGTWSLRQIIHLFDYKEAMIAIRGHLCQYLVMYATITAPKMSKNPEDYWTGDTVDQTAWDQIIQEALNKDHDDHVFKVIYHFIL